jgi:hypothetical protein
VRELVVDSGYVRVGLIRAVGVPHAPQPSGGGPKGQPRAPDSAGRSGSDALRRERSADAPGLSPARSARFTSHPGVRARRWLCMASTAAPLPPPHRPLYAVRSRIAAT